MATDGGKRWRARAAKRAVVTLLALGCTLSEDCAITRECLQQPLRNAPDAGPDAGGSARLALEAGRAPAQPPDAARPASHLRPVRYR